jgi:hypothetical protein
MAAVLCVAAVAGCAARPGGDDATPSAEEPPPGRSAAVSEVPEGLVQEMIADLASRTGAAAGEVAVVRAAAVTWNDASLGCGEPGRVYLQMLTEGYRVILRHAGKQYDYRSGGGGSFVLCERPDRKDPVR